jgi:hypothetical protein
MEFTWNEWTHVRHSYLCARHQERFHPEEWRHDGEQVPSALAALETSVRAAIAAHIEPGLSRHGEVPELEEIHTFLEAETAAWLIHLLDQPVTEQIAVWASGHLPLLVLRLLELETIERMGWARTERQGPVFDDAATSYGYETWFSTGSDAVNVAVEGHLEDIAYHVLAHGPDAVVTIESQDGTECFFAASLGLIIGVHPLVKPAQGDLVRIRRWAPGQVESWARRPGSIGEVELRAAERALSERSDCDVLVRFVLLVDGAEEAPISWALWTAEQLHDQVGYELEDDEPQVWEVPDESDPVQPQSRSIGRDRSTPEAEANPPIPLERVDQPAWARDRDRDRTHDHELLGDQSEWAYALPWMYRALASDHPGATMPRCPRPDDEVHHGPAGYWAALYELLVHNLGWSRPALGIDWWLQSNRPVHDRKLRLLRDVWLSDGLLDWFRAWLYTVPPSMCHDDERLDVTTPTPSPSDSWFDNIRREVAESRFRSQPFGGGTDPLHLLSHGRRDALRPHVTGRRDRRGTASSSEEVVLLPGLGGWYGILDAYSPDTRVELMVPWIGSIGVFTQSPSTGIWHSTSEEIHLAGNLTKML